jgi:hypothetical protein
MRSQPHKPVVSSLQRLLDGTHVFWFFASVGIMAAM